MSESKNKVDYWDQYYTTTSRRRSLPSQFAVFVAGEFREAARVIELGCGNGRDSLFFAEYGHTVIGIDASNSAIESCSTSAKELGSSARFIRRSIDDPSLGSSIGAVRDSTVVYARFFLHAITDAEEEGFFETSRQVTKPGDTLAVEYRTIRDREHTKVTESHYRRFIDPAAFVCRAAEQGFAVAYNVEGFGFAKYQADDAYVARALLTRV